MLLLIALALAGLLIFRPKHRAETPPATPAAAKTAAPATEPPLTAPAATEPAAAPAVAPTFASGGIGAPAATATVPAEIQVELDNVKLLIRDYRLALGENPVGSNAEITRALTGANPKKTRFVAAGDARLNERGEWVDPWRTPYFFHQISGREMEIRSAGPDRRMWTADDIVLR
jgi:hypothetical protein